MKTTSKDKRAHFLKELRILAVLVVIAFSIKGTLFEIYVVPTGSMEDTILTGDVILGNKYVFGMRTPEWIGIPYTRFGFEVPSKRFPKYRDVRTGDITIFEFPRDPFQKYVKRCIGTPGDSVQVHQGKISVNGKEMDFPAEGKFTKGRVLEPDEVSSPLYPHFDGNMDNIAAFQVPFKGMEIDFSQVKNWIHIITLLVLDGRDVTLDQVKVQGRKEAVVSSRAFTVIDPQEVSRTHGFLKYKLLRLVMPGRKQELHAEESSNRTAFTKKLFAEYSKENLMNPWYLRLREGDAEYLQKHLRIDGKSCEELGSYQMQQDFFFFMGDNRDHSYDSRFWGFVPKNRILGTPLYDFVNLFKFLPRFRVLS